MKEEIFIPDMLWHRWKRLYPNGDLAAILRQVMREDIDRADAENPESMHNRILAIKEKLG